MNKKEIIDLLKAAVEALSSLENEYDESKPTVGYGEVVEEIMKGGDPYWSRRLLETLKKRENGEYYSAAKAVVMSKLSSFDKVKALEKL